MSGARRRAILLVIVTAIPVTIAAQLNPTVKVLPRAKTALPAECDQSLAAQPALRLTPEERTSVRDTSRDMIAPPSRSLRSELQTAFDAAQHNSRDAFRDALVQAKSMLTSYPPGGEKTAASNLVDVLNDVDKIWDYQFTSPTGAFFDTSSEPYRVASKYPGWDAAIRRQIITDQNGAKFYPTHETRDFLLAESAQRLSHLTGKPVPAPVSSTRGTTTIARPAPRVTPPAPLTTTTTSATTPKPKPHHTTKQTTTETTTRPTTHVKRPAQHHTPRQPVVREARATPPPVHTTPPPPPPPKVKKPEPAPAPAPSSTATVHTVTTETPITPPPPATTSSAATASSETAVTTPASTTSAPSSTETSATTETTATTESNAPAKPSQSRSLFGPILLIIVGIGLLLTLWRASS